MWRVMMKKLFFVLILAAVAATDAMAQTFQARVNRDAIPEGETFLLSLDLEGASTSDAPDFSALDKDFTVYSVSNAYRTNIVNGNMTQSQQWNLVMMPKKTGKLTIPAIKLDKWQSQPVEITVAAAGEEIGTAPVSQSTNQPRFKIDAAVDNTSPYVQQQINYTLTIYDTGGLQGEEPIFTGGSDDWIIKALGAPEITSKTVDGKHLREIKFHYALFPQKSGELTIPSARFNGFYLTREKRRDPFGTLFNDDLFIAGFGMADIFATRNPVVLNTKPIKINVLPAAASNNGNWWLPASDVELFAQFEPANPVFKTGEAVNRTIYLKAGGVADTQLPEIRFASTEGMKQYPEKPQTQMTVENGKIVSVEKIANVYIPQQAGEAEIPAIEVPWFNVGTKRMEKAVLPAMKINVLPGLSMPAPQQLPVTENPRQPEISAQPSVQPVEEVSGIKSGAVYWMLGGAFAAGLLLSFLLMRLFTGKTTPKPRNHKKHVLEKAREKDLRALRDALFEWARHRYHRRDISSLKEIEDLVKDSQFDCELEKLSEALYAKDSADWQAGSFIKVFERISKRKAPKKDDNAPLPKLYK